jgi:2-methylcitrate dehydratase PrpD
MTNVSSANRSRRESDPATALAHYVTDTSFTAIPGDVFTAVKLQLIDALACLLGGSAAFGCPKIRDAAAKLGGAGEATILNDGRKTSPLFAALANGAMVQALDFDDVHEGGGTHSYAPVLPAVMAAAEARGGLGGRQFLTALTLGIEIHCRVAASVRPRLHSGWHPTAMCGIFGAAAGAARALGCDAGTTRHAMGLAYSSAAGTRQPILDGVLAKRLQSGLAAQAGLQAAFLARAGITGSTDFLQGVFGFSEMFAGGQMDLDVLAGDLGDRYELRTIALKPYPCCRSTHAAVDVALDYTRSHKVRPEAIREILVYGPKLTVELVGAPFAIRENPQVDAQFSIPYAVATALLRKAVEIEDFTPDVVVARSEVHRLASRITVHRDDSLLLADGQQLAVLEVVTDEGTTRVSRPFLKGNPKDPLTHDEVMAKLRSCAAIAAQPLRKTKLDGLVNVLDRIELLPDVADLVQALCP